MATIRDLDEIGDQNLQIKGISRAFLFFCFLVTFFYFSLLLRPFFSLIIFSALSAIALAPVHRRIVILFRNSSLAAMISCVLFVFAIIIPLIAFIFVLKDEVLSLYTSAQLWLQPGMLGAVFQWTPGHTFFDIYQRLIVNVPVQSVDITVQLMAFIRGMGNFLIKESQLILQGSIHFFIGFLVMLLTLFYFFRDGKIIVSNITHFSLLPQHQEEILVSKIRSLMSIIFYGILLSALTQGIIGVIGFSIVGLERPLLLGIFVAFLSPIPYVGTALVWVPTVVLLYVSGDYWQAIFLALWCATVMSSVDAFLKPLFIGRQANIHSLLMFLALIGGMTVYGPSGLVLGPFIALLVVVFSEMYLENKEIM